jgi:hypothetical protein
MDNEVSHLSNICPDPSRWLAVAAGGESPETGAQLTEHAANCAACAGQLREAIGIMADGTDPAEERFVAMLKSSQPAWQKQMARELSANLAPLEEPRPRRTIWWNWRLSGALAAAVVVIGVASQVIVQSLRQSRQSAGQALVGTPRASGSPAAGGPPPSQNSAAKSPEATAVQSELLAIVLESDASRGVEQLPEFKLRPEIQTVAATLHFREAPPAQLSLKVEDFGGRVIWTTDLTMTDQEMKLGERKVDLPAKLFPAGDYRILVSHVTGTEARNVSNYAFRVKR